MGERADRDADRRLRLGKARALGRLGLALYRDLPRLEAKRDALAAAVMQNQPGSREAFMDWEERSYLAELYAAHSARTGLGPIVPVKPAASGNSVLQEAILEVLADGEYALTRDILGALEMAKPTAAQRVTVSRALSRLADKGLLGRFAIDSRTLQGRGFLWRRLR